MPDDEPPLVLVEWEDAKSLDSGVWVENKDHAYSPHIVRQVGFILCVDDRGLILSHAWHPETVATRDQIPTGMIRSITMLAPVKKGRK